MKPSREREFSTFVQTHGDRLLRFARLLIHDAGEAEDALQLALLRTARHWSGGIEFPEAYVRRTLVNIVRDRARRRHLVPVPVEERPESAPSALDHAEAYAARARLEEVLATLPHRQRLTVVLRVIEGYSEAETARLLKCSAGTVKSNLSRGLRNLRPLFPADEALRRARS